MNQVIVGIAVTCMLVGLGESGTNCQIGNCGCNKKTININRPGAAVRNFDVCCPQSGSVKCSKYVRAGSANATRNAFCSCDYIRITGSCLKGEQCTPLTPIRASLNTMPICCQRASDNMSIRRVINEGQISYTCACVAPAAPAPWSGDCWQGSQCNSCDPGIGGNVNGLRLCCANCQQKGLSIDAGRRTCNCNN